MDANLNLNISGRTVAIDNTSNNTRFFSKEYSELSKLNGGQISEVATGINSYPITLNTPKFQIDDAIQSELNKQTKNIDIDTESLLNYNNITNDWLTKDYTTSNNSIDTSNSYNPNPSQTIIDSQQYAQQSNTSLVNAQQSLRKSIGTAGSNGTNLISTISGSDLSVFFMTEVPNAQDVSDGIPSYLWRKEMLLLELDSVMSFTYSIVREVFPVRSIGTSKPKSYTRGPIGIAGSLCFTVFAEDVLVRLRTQMQQSIKNLKVQLSNSLASQNNKKISVDPDIIKYNKEIAELKKKQAEINATWEKNGDITYDEDEEYKDNANEINVLNSKIGMKSSQISTVAADNSSKAYQQYIDALNQAEVYMLNQIAPFNLLVMGTNDQGTFSKMMLKGVRVIDENQMQGVQQPNIVNKITFSAEDVFPLMSGSYTAGAMDFTAIASKDQNSPVSSNQYATYTGSQLLKDALAMDYKTYQLNSN